MNDVDRLKQSLQQARAEFANLDEWERLFLSKRLVELGKPISQAVDSDLSSNEDYQNLS